MRCKSCLRIFSQPSDDTKKIRLCSICRGVRKGLLKQREMCEKTTKMLINREIVLKKLKNIPNISVNSDQYFIEQRMQQNGTLWN